jgi:ElaB/YqjD/DUF883 family membrane-anchored ribosome-binding protein
MPSENVLQSLQILEENLKKLEPAIKHVEMALKLTAILNELPSKFNVFLKDLKDSDVEHKEQLRKEINQLIKDASKVFNKLQEELTESIKKIYDTTQSFEDLLVKLDEAIDRLMSIDIETALHDLVMQVTLIGQLVHDLQDMIRNLGNTLLEKLTNIEGKINQLKSSINEFRTETKEKLDRIYNQGLKLHEEQLDNTNAKVRQLLIVTAIGFVAVISLLFYLINKG